MRLRIAAILVGSAIATASAQAESGICVYQDDEGVPVEFENKWGADIRSVSIIHSFSRDKMAIEVRSFEKQDLALKRVITSKDGTMTLRATIGGGGSVAPDTWGLIVSVAPKNPTKLPKYKADWTPDGEMDRPDVIYVLSAQGSQPTVQALLSVFASIKGSDVLGVAKAYGVDVSSATSPIQKAAAIEPIAAQIMAAFLAQQLPSDPQHMVEASFNCEMVPEDKKKPTAMRFTIGPTAGEKPPEADKRDVTITMPGGPKGGKKVVIGRMVETTYTSATLSAKLTQDGGKQQGGGK